MRQPARRRINWRSDSACSRIELGTTNAGVSTSGYTPAPMLGTSGTINWNCPGEVIIPRVIATAKSVRPRRFQAIAVLRPWGVPLATAVAAGVFSGAEAEGFTASGGDDYELLFTLPPAALASLQAELARGEITVIGTLASGAGLWLMAQGVPQPATPGGFDHFG